MNNGAHNDKATVTAQPVCSTNMFHQYISKRCAVTNANRCKMEQLRKETVNFTKTNRKETSSWFGEMNHMVPACYGGIVQGSESKELYHALRCEVVVLVQG